MNHADKAREIVSRWNLPPGYDKAFAADIAAALTEAAAAGREAQDQKWVKEIASWPTTKELEAELDALRARLARVRDALEEILQAAHEDDEDANLAARVRARLPQVRAALVDD